MATKMDIFREHLTEYLKADKHRKGELLSAVSSVTRMHRKAAVRKFRALQMCDPRRGDRRGRSEHYTPDVSVALKDVWTAGGEVCGELMHPMIAEYVMILRRDRLWSHGASATEKLLMMSQATVKRRIGAFERVRRKRGGLSSTRPSFLKTLIPIFTGPWVGMPPGFGQADTVIHSDSLAGDFVYTLNYTDAATLAVIPRAQWNKSQEATQKSLAAVKTRLPFPLRGLHPDTGSEFINRFIMQWCRRERINLSRSRPGHKNDNMYVEERNGHVVRKYVGYIKLDCVEAVEALNHVYDVLTPYLLHFVAVRRSIGKERIGSKYRRTYEHRAKTPYQRIMEHEAVSAADKDNLRREHERLNPLILKREIEKRIATLYAVQKRYGAHRVSPEFR